MRKVTRRCFIYSTSALLAAAITMFNGWISVWHVDLPPEGSTSVHDALGPFLSQSAVSLSPKEHRKVENFHVQLLTFKDNASMAYLTARSGSEIAVAVNTTNSILMRTSDKLDNDSGRQEISDTIPKMTHTNHSLTLVTNTAAINLSSLSNIVSKGLPFLEPSDKDQHAQSQHHGDLEPPRALPLTNRKIFRSMDDLVSILPQLKSLELNFDTSTINPILPSSKIQSNPLTMWNTEIPLNYSILAPMTSTIPWSNCTTLAYYEGKLRSGFRNQMMAFVILILEANRNISKSGDPIEPHGQILLKSLGQKDTYGTNWFIPFSKLWDVAHWNSHYPQLPRLVDYDPILHGQFDFDRSRWHRTPSFDTKNASFLSSALNLTLPPANWFGTYGLFASASPMRPFGYGYQHRLMTAFKYYAKGKGQYAVNVGKVTASHRNPSEILMLQGAMRPHPDLQEVIDRLLIEASLLPLNQSTAVSNSGVHPQLDYMTLHARVEPDMQKHPVCRDKKVLNLTEIFDMMERQWRDPPVAKIFMPINRQYLEMEGNIEGGVLPQTKQKKNPNKSRDSQDINWIAVANLQALNHARDYGLWNGRAKVIEFGANALPGTRYANKPSTAGAMLNFFAGVPARIFIGTEVSSFSHDLLATRLFRGYTQNYKYLPDGLHDWTPPGTIDPPGFRC